MLAHEVLPAFYALHPVNQALVIVCIAGLIAFFIYGAYRMWQQLDD
jgi:hypothetical protein